ncbi:hypothetical protein E3O25_08115 [Cryobacterium sp. TMT1-3]|uniref:hypothetical protein n=1 Tax=Cryobacterium sp. TMT1-3 TaxID=1259237 RepID=UPI00106C9A1B|nr:hypothetical protein [Cryobacterium sp. TMT1-3]TFC28506.1 hypothetical protein E3O25_08115 [Cryobacterium sp. TMT1-3]
MCAQILQPQFSQSPSPSQTPSRAGVQAEAGSIRSAHYLPATRQTVLWGRLPCARDVGVLTIDSGDEVTIGAFPVLSAPLLEVDGAPLGLCLVGPRFSYLALIDAAVGLADTLA